MSDFEGNFDGMENEVILLTDENGEETPFEMLGVVEHGEDTYLALGVLADEEEGADAGEDVIETEVVFMLVVRDENGEDCYEAVEDDELVDILFEKFLAQQEEDFEEFDGTEDEDSAEE